MRKLSRSLPILFILLALVVFFGRAIFTDKVLLPADMLLKELPWGYQGGHSESPLTPLRETVEPSHLQNHYVGDVLHVFYPMKAQISESLRNGDFPLWSPEVSCGYPLFASGLHDVISLSGLLLLFSNVDVAHNLLFILELFLAGTFMYFYLRTIRVGIFGALVAAVAFMFNFLFMAFLLFEHIVGAVLWLPLIFLLLEQHRSKGSYAYLCLAGLFTGIAVLNGSIQSMLYVLLAIFIYFAYHAYYAVRIQRSARPLLKGALSFSLIILVGLSIAAVKLIPMLEFLLGCNERSGRFTLGEWLTTLWKKPLVMAPLLVGSVFPDLIGSHHALDVTKILGSMGGGEGMSGNLFKAYIGIFPFIFALIAIFYRRCGNTKLFIWMAVIPILLILFTPLYLVLYFRGFVLYAFAASVLAGLGADWLLNSGNRNPRCDAIAKAQNPRCDAKPKHRVRRDEAKAQRAAIERTSKQLRWILIVGFAMLLVGNIFLYAFKGRILAVGHGFMRARIAQAGWFNYDVDWQLAKVDNMVAHYSIFNHRMYLPFLIGALCFILLWALGKGMRRTVFALIVIPIIFLDLARLGWDYVPMVDKSLVFPETESVKFLKQDKGLFRVASTWDRMKEPPVFPPNTLLPYGVSHIKVYESLVPKQLFPEQSYSLSNVKYVLAPPGTKMPKSKYQLVFDRDIWIYENKEVLPRAYTVSRAKFVRTEEEVLQEMNEGSFDPRDIVLIQQAEGATPTGNVEKKEAFPPRPPASQYPNPVARASSLLDAQVVRYTPERVEIVVKIPGDGFLVLSDRYYPGWEATVDGERVSLHRANHIFRAVELEEGRHDVIFDFRPSSFQIGLYVSILGATVSAMGIGCSLFAVKIKNRRSGSEVRRDGQSTKIKNAY